MSPQKVLTKEPLRISDEIVGNKSMEIIPLRDYFKDDFLIGASIHPIEMETKRDLLTTHFNSLVTGNDFKWGPIHPKEGEYYFENTDAAVAFAKQHGMKMRGHTLVWHNQTPSWVFKSESGSIITKEDLLGRIEEHIKTVVSRYKGQVDYWDVVNEAIGDGEDLYRSDSPWYQIIGEEFIEKAFRFAHEADPDALLFYNDYNCSNPVKRDKIYTLVKQLKEKGVPIHGIGMQEHNTVVKPIEQELREAIKKFASLNVVIHITELDVSVFASNDKRTDLKQPTETMMKQQVEQYKMLFDVYSDFKDVIELVTFWGVADDRTWKDNKPVKGRKDWPLLFDINQKPKPAYWRVIKQPVLDGITVSNGVLEPSFETGILEYTVRATQNTETVRILPVIYDSESITKMDRDGDIVAIKVTAYGKINTYTVKILQ